VDDEGWNVDDEPCWVVDDWNGLDDEGWKVDDEPC